MTLKRDGEAQYSCLAHAPFDDVWAMMSQFDAAGGLLCEEAGVECCVIENDKKPTQVGAVRRLVWPSPPDSGGAQGPLLRERLEAYYDSPLKRYYTATLLPYEGCFAGRSPLPCAVDDLAVTFTASPVTAQEKSLLEFYATYRVESAEDDDAVRGFLTQLFRHALRAAVRRFPAHACDDALPEALLRLSADAACEKHHEDIEKVVTMWRAAVAAERGMLEKLAEYREELADKQRVLDAALATMRDEGEHLRARADAAEAERDDLRRLVAGATADPPPPAGDAAGAAPLYSSPPAAEEYTKAEAEAAARWEEEQARLLDGAGPTGAGGGGAGAAGAAPAAQPREPCGTPFAGSAKTVGVCITQQQIREQFDKLDTNGNGFLSRDELRAFYIARDNFGVYESDDVIERTLTKYLKDGKVTLPEFSMLMLKIAQR